MSRRSSELYRKHVKSEEHSLTAPDYSVEEDNFGRLINREKRMIWPETKPRTRIEFERIIKLPPAEVPVVSPAPSTSTDIYLTSSHSLFTEVKSIASTPDPEVEQAFIGGSSPKEAAAKVDPSAFVLYYRIDEPLSDKAYLYMAYKNNQGTAFHFPLTCRKAKHDDGSETAYWRVEYGDPEAKEAFHFPLTCRKAKHDDGSETAYWRVEYGDPEAKEANSISDPFPLQFPCLSALVRHHQVFSYYDFKTGAIEAFPLWSGDQVVVDRD
ncbi:hypothetical protein OESDEN_16838 [Oesophagostomum dentatum]|uniref:Uncharacterized protein n=1 Tax=Oesophagostomum dentatum TaxID=61180 RepID=A0A0B1SJQ3_OESDE|nr:hypothetical protein OESDEN_16838 [Oesophagostomum dentatum]